MSAELVSIIVPVYNGEKYIANMVRALKDQTYTDFEAIIVNDGSTDNTERNCLEAIGEDVRFRIINKSNSGPSDTRNVGLRSAKGEYVAFVDADDYIFPNYIQYLYTLIKKYDADMSCCDYCKLQNGKDIPDFIDKSNEVVYDKMNALKHMYRKKYVTGYPVIKLFKRCLLEDIYFPTEISYAEDIVFIDKVIKNCETVVYGDKVLYIYYQNVSSLTHTIDVAKLKKAWNYHLEYFEKVSMQGYPELYTAVKCKQFVMAMDLCSRIYKVDIEFREQLISYVKSVSKGIRKDIDSTTLQRFLAGMCCISTRGTVWLCVLFNWYKAKFKIQIKKAV